MPTREEELEEIDRWIASLGSPEDDARDFLSTARYRGARIKKGRPTERVLFEMLVPLMQRLRETQS